MAWSHLPRGRCGLKFEDFDYLLSLVKSPSARKVWIEIFRRGEKKKWLESHLPRGRCGLKCIVKDEIYCLWHGSPSARKVWIEIVIESNEETCELYVTFREEGVDWNRLRIITYPRHLVTFREEGVDWNSFYEHAIFDFASHLPRGRCGLKYLCTYTHTQDTCVTFREEGVDWNMTNKIGTKQIQASPSARKVWIEMPNKHQTKIEFFSHLPRGRCGLKYWLFDMFAPLSCHLPRGRCGLKCLMTLKK